ncbi:hypothetical protein [Micromonospora andamanensis]|uniref:hypothetical protein n=1 Tax=Micromonospora andamanensis TaxID=1287068 RepID=UPI00195188B6|nr:hypothetical protein [Micromonospora andamanensis]
MLFNPDRQATPTAIAFAAAVLVLPYSLVGPFAGVLLDRWSRRTGTVVTNLVRAGVVLPIAAMIFFGSEGPLFFVSTLVVIGLGRLLLSGLSAATPHVVPGQGLVTANAGRRYGGVGGVLARVGLRPASAADRLPGWRRRLRRHRAARASRLPGVGRAGSVLLRPARARS